MRRALQNLLLYTGIYKIEQASVSISPTLGTELVTNGDFSSWSGDNPTSWTIMGTEDASNYVTQNGSSAQIISNGSKQLGVTQNLTGAAVKFIQCSINIMSGTVNNIFYNGAAYQAQSSTGIKTYSLKTADAGISFYANNTTSNVVFDDISAKEYALSSLMKAYKMSVSDITASVKITRNTSLAQQGLVINLDSESDPKNFVIAYIDGARCKLDKCVNGTYTNLINAATTYSAGATLQISKVGTSYTVTYNGSAVGTAQTIADSGIVNNKLHGIFGTDGSATFATLSITKN